MIDREQARQICCVVKRIIMLLEMKVKGSLTVHFDGGGQIGQQFDENFKQWRDKFSKDKRGIPLDEDEFIRIMMAEQ